MNDFAASKQLDGRLRFAGTTVLRVTNPARPSTFFGEDNQNVVVDPKFMDVLVDDEDLWTGKVTLSKYLIARGSSDEEVEKRLPKEHVFEANQFCQVIIAKIKQQDDGHGDLLTNDSATLCYVKDKRKETTFVVDLRLAGAKNRRRWHLLSLGRYGNLHGVGFQVLSLD